MTPKRLAEFWFTQFTLTGIKPVWWKQIYIYIVFKKLRFRLMVKRGPRIRPQASEGEAQHGLFCWTGCVGQGDERLRDWAVIDVPVNRSERVFHRRNVDVAKITLPWRKRD